MRQPDIQIKDVLVEEARSATAYFQRWLQTLNTRLTDLETAVAALIASLVTGTASGSKTGTPDGSGYFDITHGLSVTPDLNKCRSQTVGTAFAVVTLVSVTGSTLRVKLWDAAGVAITAGTWTVNWTVAA